MERIVQVVASAVALAATGAAAQSPGAAAAPVAQSAVDATASRGIDQSATVAPSGEAALDTRGGAGDIIVTATRRASRLTDVPVAVQAVTPVQLQNTGATDIRQLTQIAPSLLVSSTSSEAGAAGARIRGIGTVGDNPGLESSVPVFIDGVYRNRPGVALNELGSVEQIEVLRGPQGTLFGRNASAGLINITTARPDRRKFGGFLDGTYGNYDFYRFAGGVTGPLTDTLSFRIDGAYNHRDGFIKDVVSDRRFNDRDRYIFRGKLLFEPNDRLSILAIGDYSRQKEQCCAAVYLRARDRTRNPDGTISERPSTIAQAIRGLTSVVPGAGQGQVLDDTYRRRGAYTPGRDYRSNVEDWGASVQADLDLDFAKLTSITGYRYNNYNSAYDVDYNNLDILSFPTDSGRFTRFRTFSQELRLQGSAFDDKLDWLVGGYYSNEKLTALNTLQYGQDFDQYAREYTRIQINSQPGRAGSGDLFALIGGYPQLSSFAGLATLVLAPGAGGTAIGPVAAAVRNLPLFAGTGVRDVLRQTDNNYALFTHNIFHVTDRLSLTLGARHTWDNKTFRGDYNSNTPCGTYSENIQRLTALGANGATDAIRGAALAVRDQLLLPLIPIPCVANGVNGDFAGRRKEREWSGTAVVTWKPTDRIMTYASYSRGYKAGGFNLDRAQLLSFQTARVRDTANLDVLQFRPETVDAFEGGIKVRGGKFDLALTGFYERFNTFQLNSFDGFRFFVTDIRGCRDDLGGRDRDRVAGNSSCSRFKPGVTTRGFELETYFYPVRGLTLSTGFTLADTKYARQLSGTRDENGDNSLDPSLALLPGRRVSNSSLYVVTGSSAFTPRWFGLQELFYVDFRYQSGYGTGSDLFPETEQKGVMTVNGRVGLGSIDGGWRIEGWVQNAFNVNYKQVGFSTPLQGSPTVGGIGRAAPGQTTLNTYSAFLAEPRTYGLTVRTKF